MLELSPVECLDLRSVWEATASAVAEPEMHRVVVVEVQENAHVVSQEPEMVGGVLLVMARAVCG
jgi:hypothetical protein